MPSYVPINDEMCLVNQEVKSKITVQKRESVNHIWIYDRSGSMYSTLGGLCEQLMTLSKKLPKGDTLSLGWFSGEGDFNFIIKGFKINADSDYDVLEQAIRRNSTVRNTTCFSDILHNTSTVIEDLSIMSNTFSLHFFTDGYPVVSNYRREIERIFKTIDKIKGKVHSAMFIGYGFYYNKELMAQMAEKLGALLIHSTMVAEYSDSITRLVKLSETQEPKQEVDSLVADPLAVFTISDQGVVLSSVDNGKLFISPQKGRASIFYVSKEKPNKKSWKRIETKDINFADAEDKLAKGIYAATLVLTQQAKTDLALEFIGKAGDKKVVDALTNAFTIEEYGIAENIVDQGIQNISVRFSEGRDPNYLPADDAFCAFDLLNTLVADERAKFYPYHKDFEYERIGPPTKTNEDYPKFIVDPDGLASSSFNNLVWHSSRLNLSVLARIVGAIHTKEVEGTKAKDVGLPEFMGTHIFRNYTFIKDGRVHVKKVRVSTSEDTYLVCKNHGLVINDDFSNSGFYTIDLSSLPAINRKIATGSTSATDLCKLAFEEQKLKGQIKALKWLKNEVLDEEKAVSKTYNDDQIAFLEANGLNMKKGGLYNPPTEKAEVSDQYIAKSFKIKIAKMMSLPTVKKVMEKIAAGKSRTPVEYLVEEGINMYEASKDKLDTDEKKKGWFDFHINFLRRIMLDKRTQIQQTKFAVILGKKWFDEFSSREENTIEVDGYKFTFELGEETVNI